jgi:hypothetical protein
MNTTCPWESRCWHGDVCGTRSKIDDRPECFRSLKSMKNYQPKIRKERETSKRRK